MSNVTIYRFEVYDIITDGLRPSRRWATKEAINSIQGSKMLEDTAVEVDASVVGGEIPGMTEIGYRPNAHSGFQTQVYPGLGGAS
jgi:hypothetical protein